MKKILILFMVAVAFFACKPEDPLDGFMPGMEPGNPNLFFRFKALDGGEDFGVHLIVPYLYFNSPERREEYYKIEGYSKRRIVIAFTEYKNLNNYNEAHARALDKIAEEYKGSGLEFAIIFTDQKLTEDSLRNPPAEMAWVQDIHNIRLFYDPYPDPSGLTIDKVGSAALLQPSTQFPTNWMRPYTYYMAHDKIYSYPEKRYTTGGVSEKESEELYYEQMSQNIQTFIADANKGV